MPKSIVPVEKITKLPPTRFTFTSLSKVRVDRVKIVDDDPVEEVLISAYEGEKTRIASAVGSIPKSSATDVNGSVA